MAGMLRAGCDPGAGVVMVEALGRVRRKRQIAGDGNPLLAGSSGGLPIGKLLLQLLTVFFGLRLLAGLLLGGHQFVQRQWL